MWRINSLKLTLQEVLIMAYMNVLEGSYGSSCGAVTKFPSISFCPDVTGRGMPRAE
jgi:hypothetical protein